MKKFLSYILTFALLFFISAVATISLNSGGGAGLINTTINSGDASSSSLFNGLLETFGKNKRFNVKGTLTLSYEEEDVPVILYVDVDITDQNNIKLDGYVNIKYNDEKNVIEFSYYNNTIYLTYNDNSIKLETKNVFSLMNYVTELLPNKNSESSINENKEEIDIMESLMPLLMESLDGMKETELVNEEKKIELNLADLATVILVTNKENVPRSVLINTSKFKGFSIKLDLNFEFNEDLFIYNPETKNNAKEYFDVSEFKNIFTSIKNLNNFNTTISLSVDDYLLKLNLLSNIGNENYRVDLLHNDFGYLNKFNLVYKDKNIYTQFNEIGFLIKEQVFNDFENLLSDMISDVNMVDIISLKDLLKNIDISNFDINKLVGFTKILKEYKVDNSKTYVVLDTSEIGLNYGQICLSFNYDDSVVKGVTLENLIIDGKEIDFVVEIESTEDKVVVENTNDYLDISKLYSNNKDYFTKGALNFDLNVLFNNNSNQIGLNSNVQFDLNKNYGLTTLKVNVANKIIDIEIEVLDDAYYVTLENRIKLKLSKSEMIEMINKFGFDEKQLLEIINIQNKLDFTLNEKTIFGLIYSVEEVVINGEELSFNINLSEIGLESKVNVIIGLNDLIIKDIKIELVSEDTFVDVDFYVKSNQVTEKQINKKEYLDVKSFYDSIVDIVNFNEGNIWSSSRFNIDGKLYELYLDFAGSLDKEYLNLKLELSGYKDLSFNFNYYDNNAFINVNNIYLKTQVENIFGLFGGLSSDKLDVQQILNGVSTFENIDLSILEIIKNIKINNSQIKLYINGERLGLIEDFTITIEIARNKFRAIEIGPVTIDENNSFVLNIVINPCDVEIEKVNEAKYLDVENVIKNTTDLVESKILNIYADIDVLNGNFEKEYGLSFDFNKLLKNKELTLNTLLSVAFENYSYSINGIYQNNTSFIDFNGTKLMIETDRIYETVSRITDIINENPELINKIVLELEDYLRKGNINLDKNKVSNKLKSLIDIENIDLIKIIWLMSNELSISSEGIFVDFDATKIGLNSNIDFGIKIKDTNIQQIYINELKIKDKYLDVNINIDTIEKQLVYLSENEQKKYINVAEFVKVIESAYNTIKTKSITGFITLKFEFNGNPIYLDVNYGFKLNDDNELVIYLSTKLLNKDIKIYVIKDTIHLEIQGLKFNIKFNEIPELLNWLNDEFNLNIELPTLNTSLIEEKVKDIYSILGIISNLDVSKIIDKVVFGETSMEVIVDENSTLFINYGNELNQIIINENGSYFEFNIETKTFDLEDVDLNSFNSYKKVIEIYESIANTITTENNFLINFNLNINNENIEAQIHLDKDFNVSIKLINNSFEIIDSFIITYIEGELYLKVNDIQVLISEDLLSDAPEYLTQIIDKYNLHDVIFEICNFITTQKNNVGKINPIAIVYYISNLQLTDSGINITIDSKEFGFGNEIVLSINHSAEKLSYVSVQGLILNNDKLNIILSINETNDNVSVLNPEYYNDVYKTILENIDYFNNGSIDFNISVNALINGELIPVVANVKLDINNSYIGVNLFVDYKTGYNINLEVVNGEFYLKINNIKVKISEKQLLEYVGSLDLTAVYNLIENLYSEVKDKSSEISYYETIIGIINQVKYISLNSNEIRVDVAGRNFGLNGDLKLSVVLENNIIKQIKLDEIKVSDINNISDITINSNIVNTNNINTQEYIDVVNFTNNINSLLGATEGVINLDINANVFGNTYLADVDMSASLDKNYLDLTLSLTNAYNLYSNLTVVNGDLYLQLNDIFVKIKLENILGLVLSQEIDKNSIDLGVIKNLEIYNNLEKFIKDFNFIDLYAIKNIKANNELIELVIDKSVLGGLNDFTISIELNNNLPTKIIISNLFIDSDIQINSLTISFEEKEIIEKQFDNNKYLDLEETLNNVSNLPNLNDLNTKLNIDIFTEQNSDYNKELSFNFDYKKHNTNNNELWSLIFSILSGDNEAQMSAVYENQKIFAEYNGLKLMLETNEISNIVDTILSIAGIENNYNDVVSRVVTFLEGKGLINALSGLALPKMEQPDLSSIINIALFTIENLDITSEQTSISIDGQMFDYDGNIILDVYFESNNISKIEISKLKLGRIYIDISLDLSYDEQTIQTIPGSEHEYYINVAKLTEAIEAGYKTITQDYVTGNINLSTEIFGEDVDLIIYYGIGNNDGTFEIYIETEYKGINIKLIYQNGSLYIDIQGMRVQIQLNNINDLISLVEEEFDINIDEQKIEESVDKFKNSLPSTIEEIVGKMEIIDLSFINRIIFEDNIAKTFTSVLNNKTMIIELVNGMTLSFGYGEKIKDVVVQSDKIELTAQIDNVPKHTENYNPKLEVENYTSYTDLTQLITLLKQTVLSNNFNLELDVLTNKGNFSLDILLDIKNLETYINFYNNTFGYIEDADIIYKEGQVYLKLNELYFLLSKELINDTPDLVDSLFNKLGLQASVNELMNKLDDKLAETKNINYVDYLKYIKNIEIKSNSFKIIINANIIGLGDYDIVIYIEHNGQEINDILISGLCFNEYKIDLILNIGHTDFEVNVENSEEYIDIYKVIKENLEFFKTGELDLDVQFNVDSLVKLNVNGNVKLDLNNKEFGLSFDITGDYDLSLNINYYDDVAYIEINGIKIKTTLDKVKELLKEFGINVDIENEFKNLLNNAPKVEVEFNDIWNAIEKLTLTSKSLETNFNLDIFGVNSILDLVLNIENYLIKEFVLSNFNIEENVINANIVVNNNNIERTVINEGEYLDISETIINTKNLVNKDIINLFADVKIYDSTLKEELSLSLDLNKIFENGNLSAEALIKLIYNEKDFNIDTIYQDNSWFANFDGLKLMIEKDRLEETIQTILSIIGEDIHCYDDIVSKVISILENESLYNVLSDVNIKVSSPKELDYESIVKELLSNVYISSSEIKLNIDGKIFGFDSFIDVSIELENNSIKKILISKLKFDNKYIDVSLNISEVRKDINSIPNNEKENYINIAELAEIAEATLNTFESRTISGFFTLGFTFAGERNLVNVDYGICFDKNKGYEGYIRTNFKGLDVNIYFIDGIIYLDIIGLKLHLTFEDINDFMDWLTKFGIEIDFDFTKIEDAINGNVDLMPEIDVTSIIKTIFDIDLSFIKKAVFSENSLDAYFDGGLNIFVNYKNVVNQVIFQDGDIYVELNCTDFNKFALDINKNEFNNYTIVTDMVDAALELLKKKQVSMNAETLVYNNNILSDRVDIDLAINTLETLNIYAGIIVNNDKNTNIHFAYQDDYIYANYKNLKLALSQKSLKEILVIVLEALGVDAKTIGFLGGVAEDMNLNTDNLKEIIPNLDFGNPLNMLKLVKSINIIDGEFIITIDGKKLTGSEKSDDMTLKIKAENGDISTIQLGNVYSNGESQRFDLNIDFNEYNGVKQITDKNSYVDISGSAGILKAFVNTSQLTDYSMSGTITVIANVIGINIDMDIPVQARVKLVDGKPITYIVMDVPVIGSNVPGFTGINVNNDVPYEFGDTSVESRRLEIMYKDDFIYIYRKDVVKQTVFANRVYEKTLKLAGSEMTSDLVNYLLSYGLGFSDTIMAEIDKAIVKATDRADNPLDVSNILKGFTHTDGSDLYSILINLAEIANNDMLGDALINIYTVNNESTNYKDYIGKLAFDINMPLASVCEINLETNNLTLNNIGQVVDVSNVDSYVNNYQFKENQQYERNEYGTWEFVGEKQYTIKFIDSKGNVVNNITAPVDSLISLPTLSTIVETKADGEYTYTFAGWYLSDDFKESNKVSYTKMPRGNRTLYAKWNESIKYNRNVILNSNGGGQDSVITGLEGARFTLPILENRVVIDGQTKITYGFTGWFIDNSCTEKAIIYEIPNEDITLYAGWEEVDRYVAYNLKVIDNGTVVFNEYIGEGTNIELSGFTMDNYTKYYLTQDYTNEYTIGKMPSNDLTLYVRNRYSLNIVSAYGDIYDTTSYFYQGETYSLPSQSNYVVDNGSTRVTYTFNGWEGKTDVMPNSNLRVVASWSSSTKYYYTVTFSLCYNGNSAFYNDAKLFKNGSQIGTKEVSVKVLEGNMNLSEYSATWVYKAVFYYHYNFQGWSTSKNGSAISSVNITGNTTIYGLWSGLKTGK